MPKFIITESVRWVRKYEVEAEDADHAEALYYEGATDAESLIAEDIVASDFVTAEPAPVPHD